MAQNYIGAYQAALENERANNQPQVPTTQVFVLSESVRYGQRLTKEDVRPVLWPQAAIPEGAFTEAAALFPEGSEPRTVLRTMIPGEAVLAEKVTEPGQDAGVSSRLTRGMRAFAIRVDVTSGVSGFLRPGDRVDVYWTGTLSRSNGSRQEVTKLIQTNVRLVGIDQSADEDLSNPVVARTVTVEATPTEVAGLAQAQSTGRLSLSLVGAEDDTVAGQVEVDQKSLLGIVEEQVVEVEKEETCSIRTRRGSEVVDIPIPCTN
ncbi:pilus assembly protein CpaB [Tranquillimonas rosea]|uniref:Pilus assembly protein CpaB n=2 Tax=Tranquillimonas rosea TaxID=641238 RepID=A0A1H9UW39_9RHOB|nr:pilus assembly protein CpaB [Tranquillimonas rosea]